MLHKALLSNKCGSNRCHTHEHRTCFAVGRRPQRRPTGSARRRPQHASALDADAGWWAKRWAAAPHAAARPEALRPARRSEAEALCAPRTAWCAGRASSDHSTPASEQAGRRRGGERARRPIERLRNEQRRAWRARGWQAPPSSASNTARAPPQPPAQCPGFVSPSGFQPCSRAKRQGLRQGASGGRAAARARMQPGRRGHRRKVAEAGECWRLGGGGRCVICWPPKPGRLVRFRVWGWGPRLPSATPRLWARGACIGVVRASLAPPQPHGPGLWRRPTPTAEGRRLLTPVGPSCSPAAAPPHSILRCTLYSLALSKDSDGEASSISLARGLERARAGAAPLGYGFVRTRSSDIPQVRAAARRRACAPRRPPSSTAA
jgi:hypothetical protein